MGKVNKGTPLDDISYLSRSAHRIPALVAMSDRPMTRSELCDLTGVSPSTLRRTFREFEDRNWIERQENRYRTTQLGTFVASTMAELVTRMRTESTLREVWDYLPNDDNHFTLEMCLDAVVTISDAENPYRPVNRLRELIQDTTQFRFLGLDIAMLEPIKMELCQRIIDGMEAEIINPPRVANYIRSTSSELFTETLASGNLTIRLHDNLPRYGVSIVDDRIAISCYDPDGVTVRVLLDTDAPAAREWADTVYLKYRRETPTIPLETPDP